MSRQLRWMLAVVCVLILAAAAWEVQRVAAAPILPEKSSLPDEVLCLRNVQEVRVVAGSVPPLLIKAGLNAARIEGMVREQLKKARFNAEGGENAPQLVMYILAVEDVDLPGVVNIVAFLEVNQDVRVIRLDNKTMNLPTSTLFSFKSAKPDRLEAPAQRVVEDAVSQFIHAVDSATRAG